MERAEVQSQESRGLAAVQQAARGANPRIVSEGRPVENAAKDVAHVDGVVVQVGQSAVIAGDERRDRGRQLAGAKRAREAVQLVGADREQEQQNGVVWRGVESPHPENGQVEEPYHWPPIAAP